MNAALDTAEPGLQADQRLLDRAWLRIGIGLLVVGQAMTFSLAVNLTPPEGATYWVLHGGLILSAVGVLVFLGGDLVGSAVEALRQRRISIDLLFLVTLAGAFSGSLVATFTHTGSVYYEVVAILIVVHTTGRMLGARSRVAALRAVDRTRERFDTCEVRGAGGARVRKPVSGLAADDLVLVAPGAPISVDGVIAAGRGYVQETSMTGEWRPVSRGPGDRVLAGTFSVDGSFDIRPARGPRRLDAVLAAVAGARLAPSGLQRQADRLVAWFLPIVVTVSAATFAGWIFHASWDRALFNAMAVLLVACPCAMGLATPVAVWGGLARLASFGLVARTGDFMEALARCDCVCLDKTGTLSSETLAIHAWRIEREFQAREHWLRAAVAAAEDGLAHPVAAALREAGHTPAAACAESARQLLVDMLPVVRERRIEPGLGVVALVEDEKGHPVEVRVGERRLVDVRASSPAMKDEHREAVPPKEEILLRQGYEGQVASKLAPAREAAGKEIYVSVGGRLAAGIELAETWREGMNEALRELGTLGVEAEILTGDPNAADSFAGAGLSRDRGNGAGTNPDRGLGPLRQPVIRSGLTPQEKCARVEELKAAGHLVAFLGDGINDAAAMSAAPASIAMQAGAELARASAMAVFAGGDLRFLPRAIRVARAVRRSIRANLYFAAAYNTAGMALAAAGALHPVAAALLMVGSSAFVSVNALRSGAARDA
ncbi:MAG: HAD-IC family P-type ATPase [Opitutaceae bacterium]|nr:HAD-IC family P-type ATPase [Opitutaceae bacterium]